METPVTAICKLLDYLRDDERKDYRANPVDNHIYHSVVAVEQWIKSLPSPSNLTEVPHPVPHRCRMGSACTAW